MSYVSECPTWENTFNASLKFWSSFGYALDSAAKSGYSYLLWDGKIYSTDGNIGRPTEWTKADLYRLRGTA